MATYQCLGSIGTYDVGLGVNQAGGCIKHEQLLRRIHGDVVDFDCVTSPTAVVLPEIHPGDRAILASAKSQQVEFAVAVDVFYAYNATRTVAHACGCAALVERSEIDRSAAIGSRGGSVTQYCGTSHGQFVDIDFDPDQVSFFVPIDITNFEHIFEGEARGRQVGNGGPGAVAYEVV